MNNEFEYYLLGRKSDQEYPLIRITDRDPPVSPTLISLKFNDPIPRNPVMADFLKGPEIFFTSKIADVIKKMNLDYIKFISTELTDPKGNQFDDYLCLCVDNDIEALDKEASEFVYKYRIYSIKKFILDKEALKEIPLKDRLIFVIEEAPAYTAFHKSVVDAIMAVNPTGLQFRPLENSSL